MMFFFCFHGFGQTRAGRHNLKVIYHPLYSMNIFVTNKSKLPQGGPQVFPYMG